VRVLLVDDHTVLREGLRTVVSSYSHLQIAGEASNGEEAIELARQLQPDVVVMDVNMPKVNGIVATKQIKDQQPDTIIIGLSVFNDLDTEQKMRVAGASAYLTKETASEVLCQTIDALIRERTRKIAETNGFAPATILVIDANAQDRQYFTDHLRTHASDFQVLEATTGRSGLDVYQRRLQQIDCVVLELTLPDISAFEVLMQLVPRAEAPNVAVILLSTTPRRSLMDLAMKHGAQACLDKSQTSGYELSLAIRKAVNRVETMRKQPVVTLVPSTPTSAPSSKA
jgi:DNA-binding NarL/FixJ family response regulator